MSDDESRERLERAALHFPSHVHLAGVLADFAQREVQRERERLRLLIRPSAYCPHADLAHDLNEIEP